MAMPAPDFSLSPTTDVRNRNSNRGSKLAYYVIYVLPLQFIHRYENSKHFCTHHYLVCLDHLQNRVDSSKGYDQKFPEDQSYVEINEKKIHGKIYVVTLIPA
ncbi:hypothetical protein KSP39_PZI016038 [Platanthera zijinensis]|uniref:Uncharacterized protein n=1 Tax=Platanthera zijinensis TaxID=2320716 RepID=A0AAP0B809_9ASPA